MVSLKQIEANRRNALRSTGPRTPEGKAVVRLNSLRHGLRARTVLLSGESLDAFHTLCEALEQEWQPSTRTEQFYLEQMAIAQWKLTRVEVGEADLFEETDRGARIQLPLLDRLWQALCRLERSYARAQRELERIQAARSKRAEPEQPEARESAPSAVDLIPEESMHCHAAPANSSTLLK